MKKGIVWILSVLLCLLISVPVSAADAPRLVDGADILSDTEEASLLAKLDALSQQQEVDVVIHTVSSTGAETAQDCADNIFESFGYGLNGDRSCILLLVRTEYRDWHITTAGYGITAVTDVGRDYLSGQFLPYLSEGEYLTAFTAYADACDDLISRARGGDPFDADDLPKGPFPAVRNLLICLAIGSIAAWIYVGKHKAQLRSVRPKPAARDYTRPDSFVLAESKDIFLYKTVNRTEKPSSSGGSSTHRTGAGTRVGGGGGKF